MLLSQNSLKFRYNYIILGGGRVGKESACQCRRCKRSEFDPWVGQSPGVGMATHSSILAWRIPWIEEPGGLQSMGSQELDLTKHMPAQTILLPEYLLFTQQFVNKYLLNIKHTEDTRSIFTK